MNDGSGHKLVGAHERVSSVQSGGHLLLWVLCERTWDEKVAMQRWVSLFVSILIRGLWLLGATSFCPCSITGLDIDQWEPSSAILGLLIPPPLVQQDDFS